MVAREQAVPGQESLVARVQEILFGEDPIGINFGSNIDEYELEGQLVVIALSDKPPVDAETATALIHEVFVHTFGPETARASERYRRSAEKIRDVCKGATGHVNAQDILGAAGQLAPPRAARSRPEVRS